MTLDMSCDPEDRRTTKRIALPSPFRLRKQYQAYRDDHGELVALILHSQIKAVHLRT